jgi:hypothetical protein
VAEVTQAVDERVRCGGRAHTEAETTPVLSHKRSACLPGRRSASLRLA